MDPTDEITLWKAPQRGRDPAKEVAEGFDPNEYPGDGPYFALDRTLAEEWEEIYQNGIQEIHLVRSVFEELVCQGLIKEDSYYPGRSCYVLPEGLSVFNDAKKEATPSSFSPHR